MRMKCACVQAVAASYERLPEAPVSPPPVVDLAPEEPIYSADGFVQLTFFNDDGTCQTVMAGPDFCCREVCEMLSIKNRVPKDVNWNVVEHWETLGLERYLEDHEEVLGVYNELEELFPHMRKRFIFRKDFRKYEFYKNPEQFFPEDMVDMSALNNLFPCNGPNSSLLQTVLSSSMEIPPVCSQVWVRDNPKKEWAKAFLMLHGKRLLISYKSQMMARFLRHWRVRDNSLVTERISDDCDGRPKLFANLENYKIYTTVNAKNHLRAPTEFGLCLRAPGVEDLNELKCLACENQKIRTCWITAMRLAKYGKQLRDNYRAFKNKQNKQLREETLNPRDYSSCSVPNESIRSRVAMDFTGPTGRIVEDPNEARAIEAAEAITWRKKIRKINKTVVHGIESGIHITQPWFHNGMTRDQANNLVGKHGTVDGVFVVRNSRKHPGNYVLSFMNKGKVHHVPIEAIEDPQTEAIIYSLDHGMTKFYDLLQLVEYYQLNSGILARRLTHYLVQNPTGPVYTEKPTMPTE